MKHPDKSVLLAYTRHQSCDGWGTGEIKQHIALCQACRNYCAEFMQLSAVLETWATSPTYAPHVALTERVMEKIDHEERSFVTLLKRQLAPTSWRFVSLPAGALLVILCIAVIIALAYGHLPGSTKGGGGVVPHPVQTSAVSYTGTIVAQPTTAGNHPTLRECTTQEDKAASRVRICGSNFQPDSRVALTVKTKGKSPQVLAPITVDIHGMIEEVITISDCKDVPSTVLAQTIGKQTESSQVLENVGSGVCPTK